jgi:hypothetical protein
MENYKEKTRNLLNFRLKKSSINIQTPSVRINKKRNFTFNNKNISDNNKKCYDFKFTFGTKNLLQDKIKDFNNKKNVKRSFVFKRKDSNLDKKIFDINKKYKIRFGRTKLVFKNLSISSKETKNISEETKDNKINDIETDIQNLFIKKENKLFSFIHFIKSNNIYFFIKNSKKEHTFNKNNEYELIEDYDLPSAYRPRINKYDGMPQCIIDACSNGNVSIIKNENNCNLIWKLLPPEKMRDLIRKLNKNQKFNHFPCTYQIGLKDNMYLHFKLYKKLFPDFYNYVSDTYILPNDAEIFEKIYKKNKNILWIVKPVNMSRGRGVHLLKDLNELKELIKKSKDENAIPDLLSRYLDKPHLINKKKYDLRIYVLVASFSPLRIYLYYNGLVRFASEEYQQGNYDNIYIHLTNYSINKNNENYKSNQKSNNEIENNEDNIEGDDSNKWSLIEYRNYFKKLGLNDVMDDIWKQIENIIIKSLITVSKENCQEISINKNYSLFELYGYDILIDESFKAWLLEVNVNPSLHCDSPLDLSIKTELFTDIFNLIGIIPFNHNNGETIYNYEMMKNRENEREIQQNVNKAKKLKLPYLYNINRKNTFDKALINLKSSVVQNFNINNLKNRTNEYDNEYYKKIIEIYKEEKIRAELTGFSMIFPKKDNIEFYSKIMAKTNSINDNNIVLWEHLLNNE